MCLGTIVRVNVLRMFVALGAVVVVSSAIAQTGEEQSPVEAAASDTLSIDPGVMQFDVQWVDIAHKIDAFRIREPLADLRAVTVDASGQNYGFFFASARAKDFVVYRNGRRMVRGNIESSYELDHPVIFRMTASGDLLHAIHATQLYVNNTLVSTGDYSFAVGVESVQDHGGRLTFPEGGNVVEYDIATGMRRMLYRHTGSIVMLRRSGETIAYTLRERGGSVRMFRNGRRVSARVVENPYNFAVAKNGDVYFFTKAARGYALYRNGRSYVTGRGAGAYVAVDPNDVPWHLAYQRRDGVNDVALHKGRSAANLLPSSVANIELFLLFVDGGYAVRASLHDDPTIFHLVRDGKAYDDAFFFEYPYRDFNGLTDVNGSVVVRMFDGGEWRISADGVRLVDAQLSTVWFYRVQNGILKVYATK